MITLKPKAVKHVSISEPAQFSNVGETVSTWVICDTFENPTAFAELALSHSLKCVRMIESKRIATDLIALQTELQEQPPALIWVALFKHAGNRDDRKQQVAVRILLHQQLQSGHHVVIEGATSNEDQHGFYMPSEFVDKFCLTANKVWWCALGLVSKATDSNSNTKCVSDNTISSFSLPSRYLSCSHDGRTKRKRGIVPKRTPQSHYIATVKMLRECFFALNPASNSEDEPSPGVPELSHDRILAQTNEELAFPSNSKEKRKQKATGAKTHSEQDGPGEHEDVGSLVIKPSKHVESHYDDCGDDLAPLLTSDEKAYLTLNCFELEDVSTQAPSEHVLSSDEDEGVSSMFDSSYTNWCFPGSETSEEHECLSARPLSKHFDTVVDMVLFLSTVPGRHDICELFGGNALCTQIAIRRKLITGPNFDTTCNIDLEDQTQVKALWKYIQQHEPACIIAGPPCTAFSAWARLNSFYSPLTHAETLRRGTALANLTASLCMHQLLTGRHFLIENPWGSAIWSLPSFLKLLAMPNVAFAQLDQCMVGLTDPENQPTLKSTCFLGSCETMVERLRIRCDKSHRHAQLAGAVNGTSRCKYAQVWPRRLCELIILGIIATLNKVSISQFPTKVSVDPNGGTTVCRGCIAHAAKHDPRHTRVPNVCRFPNDVDLVWGCVSCRKFLPSTHSTHAFDDTCQWTSAAVRTSWSRNTPARSKDPIVPPSSVPPSAPFDHEEPPPPVADKIWFPVWSLHVLMTLEQCQTRDGWHEISSVDIAQTWTNGRQI